MTPRNPLARYREKSALRRGTKRQHFDIYVGTRRPCNYEDKLELVEMNINLNRFFSTKLNSG